LNGQQARQFSNDSIKKIIFYVLITGDMIFLHFKRLENFEFRVFLIQFLPWIMGDGFSISSLVVIEESLGKN
jgi:hypothetical protein